jgi:hypothetical protein
LKTEKGQIHAAGFALPGWDIIFVSHGFYPVDMLVFIADIQRLDIKKAEPSGSAFYHTFH